MILPDAEKSIPNATAACDVEVEAVEEDNLELAIVILPDAQKMMLRSDRTSLVSVLKSGTSEEDPEKRLVSGLCPLIGFTGDPPPLQKCAKLQ